MSDYAELIERLLSKERLYINVPSGTNVGDGLMDEAAAAIRELVKERGALKAENEAYRQWYDAHAAIIANYRVGGRGDE